MIERSRTGEKNVFCKECGAVAVIASTEWTLQRDYRCPRGFADDVLLCPSMKEAMSKRPDPTPRA
jgi:hypothetical protein